MLINSLKSNYFFKSTSIKINLVKDDFNSKGSFPYVSVIVPARNEQDNIERCLISLMEQNYPNFEIIVVDDNSTDNTVIKMKNIQQKHSKHQKQKKISYAYNC